MLIFNDILIPENPSLKPGRNDIKVYISDAFPQPWSNTASISMVITMASLAGFDHPGTSPTPENGQIALDTGCQPTMVYAGRTSAPTHRLDHNPLRPKHSPTLGSFGLIRTGPGTASGGTF